MTRFIVKGMSCGHCVKAITEAIKNLDSTATVVIDLAAGRVDIESLKSDTELADAINALDYLAVPEQEHIS